MIPKTWRVGIALVLIVLALALGLLPTRAYPRSIPAQPAPANALQSVAASAGRLAGR